MTTDPVILDKIITAIRNHPGISEGYLQVITYGGIQCEIRELVKRGDIEQVIRGEPPNQISYYYLSEQIKTLNQMGRKP